MFGKPRDIDDTDLLDSSAIDGFFGDEVAAANAAEVHQLQERIEQVESQISSQFTSLATYAQISQEQIELTRAEARAATERSEQRLTSLIDRERADRMTSTGASAPAALEAGVAARLDMLDQMVGDIRSGLDECLGRQRALADAISTLFERFGATSTSMSISMSTSTPISTPTSMSAARPPTGPACEGPPLQLPLPLPRPRPLPLPLPSHVVQPFDGPLTGAIADLSLT